MANSTTPVSSTSSEPPLKKLKTEDDNETSQNDKDLSAYQYRIIFSLVDKDIDQYKIKIKYFFITFSFLLCM